MYLIEKFTVGLLFGVLWDIVGAASNFDWGRGVQ